MDWIGVLCAKLVVKLWIIYSSIVEYPITVIICSFFRIHSVIPKNVAGLTFWLDKLVWET